MPMTVELRRYYCRDHAPVDGFVAAKEPWWPFWRCMECGHQAHGWVVVQDEKSSAGGTTQGE